MSEAAQQKSAHLYNRNRNDGPEVEHMTKFRYIRTVIYSRSFSALDHNIAFRILERYGREGKNNSRASLRFLETGTGAGRPAIIASLRRLVDIGALAISRAGAGTRATEYVPNCDFSGETASGIAEDTPSGIAEDTTSRGIAEDTTSGIVDTTANGSSGIVDTTESHLLKATDRWTDVSEEGENAALVGGLAAPPSGAQIPRKFKIEMSDLDTDDDGTIALFMEFSPVLGGDWECVFLNLELGSLYAELMDGSPASEFSKFWLAVDFMGHTDKASDLLGCTFWATGANSEFVFHTEPEALALLAGSDAPQAEPEVQVLPDWMNTPHEPTPSLKPRRPFVPNLNSSWRQAMARARGDVPADDAKLA